MRLKLSYLTTHKSFIQNKHILVGDTLRSIHPVAGQGWNLGIKDIQDLCSVIDKYSWTILILLKITMREEILKALAIYYLLRIELSMIIRIDQIFS